jgi:hypothetical protein
VILPVAFGILPILTSIAAVGLGIIMAGATIFHLKRKESPMAPLILLAMCSLVVWSRGFN